MSTTLTYATFTTPAGPFTVLADERDGTETVHAAGFTDDPGRLAAMLPATAPGDLGQARSGLPATEKAVAAYFDGDLSALDDVAVFYRTTGAFTRAAWDAMRGVKAGTTISYAQLAVEAGNPKANRAAGSACATNPIALFVPCHRIIRADGTSHNYLYGLECKATLLKHELANA